MKKYKIGLVGCGNISDIYIENLNRRFPNTELYALCNRTRQKAINSAEKYGIPYVMEFYEMLECREIDVVLLLTLPESHYELAKQALEYGKHVYMEKPMGLCPAQAEDLAMTAKKKGLLLGCAPDTYLGAAVQTVKKFIEQGDLGDIVGGSAFVACRGHENWHPSPVFFYKRGGGPMLDMGPYYLTALVYLCGKVDCVAGMTSRTFENRTITSQPFAGEKIEVEVETHIAGVMRLKNGGIINVMTSFDVCNTTLPFIEIYGTKGSLKLPCPNNFSGELLFSPLGTKEYQKIEILPEYWQYQDNCRGLGLSVLLKEMDRTGNVPVENAEIAEHVLKVMCAFEESSKTQSFITIQ